MNPLLRRFAVALNHRHCLVRYLESTYSYSDNASDARYRDARVQWKQRPYCPEQDSQSDATAGCCDRENDGFAYPVAASLVPMHVGTRDPEDRIGASG